MTTIKSTDKKSFTMASRRSTRFSPSTFTEKIVPVLLFLLLLALVAVFVVIGLSLVGITPSA